MGQIDFWRYGRDMARPDRFLFLFDYKILMLKLYRCIKQCYMRHNQPSRGPFNSFYQHKNRSSPSDMARLERKIDLARCQKYPPRFNSTKFDIYTNIEAASISTSRPISILEMSHYDLETDINIRKLPFRPRYRSRYLFCEDFETISIRYRYIGVFGDTDFNIHFEPISIAHHCFKLQRT